jgi:hypothetical protein
MYIVRQSRHLASRLVSVLALFTMGCMFVASSGGTATASVQLTAPANGTVVSGTISISCEVSSDVEWINLDIDSHFYGSGSRYELSYTTSWNSASVANGSHTIQCNGYNSDGSLLGSPIAYITVNNSAATPTPTPTPAPTPNPVGCTTIPGTDTPVGAACFPSSSYPTLNNAQNPVNYGADPSGANDSTAAINSALAVGDAYFSTPGTYLVSLSSGHGVIPPAGRTIECAPGVTLIERTENCGTDCGILSLQEGGNTVVGCDLQGGNSASGPVDIGSNQGQILIIVSSNNNTVEGNTFENTWGNSAVQVNPDYTGIFPANFMIQYNTFSHNAYYGPEVNAATSGTIQNNLQIDGGIGAEDDSCTTSSRVNDVTIRNNELEVSVGDCRLTGDQGCSGAAFITGGDYPPGCNYSTVTVEQNYCQGKPGTQNAAIYNGDSTYNNDILGPDCSCSAGSNC